MKDSVKRLRECVRRKDMRYTRTREEVLRAAFEVGSHFTAEDLFQLLQSRDSQVSRVTVYRAMPFLVRCGILREADPYGSSERKIYEFVYGHPHHDHLICEECGKIEEFVDERIEEIQQEVARNHGFELSGHYHDLRGVCAECQKKRKEEAQ